MQAPNLVGMKFNNLTVEKKVGADKFRRMMWMCRCQCGKYKMVSTQDLRAGRVKACGDCLPAGRKPEMIVTYCGISGSLRYWSRATHTPVGTLYGRKRNGWSDTEIVIGRKNNRTSLTK